jgi:polysaccharide biosynthesis protein PslJ
MTATALEWSGGRARLPSARIPFYLLLLGFPIWWALGAWAFMWPLLAIPLAFALLMRAEIRLPPYFAVWLLFLGWVAVSSASLEGSSTVLGFSFRAAFYLSATVVILYVFNTPRAILPTGSVVNAITAYFIAIVLGGWVAVLAPDLGWTSVVERFMPASLIEVDFVRALVHPTFSQPSDFMGYEVGRPHPFFAYTNEWGSTVALLAPVAVMARESARSPAWRWATLAALVGAVVPLVLSLNRGAWVSLIVAVGFVAMRLLISGRLRNLGRIVVLALALTGVVFLTGGAGVITDRIDHGHSDKGRGELYGETIHRSMESPVLGHGAPRPSEVSPGLPSVGTHGQWFLALFSQGIPGLVLIVGWVVLTFFGLRGEETRLSLCVRTCLLITFVQGFYYELLPMALCLLAVLIGLAWRERYPPAAPRYVPLADTPAWGRDVRADAP